MLQEPFNSSVLNRFDKISLRGACAMELGFVNHKVLTFRISCPKAFSEGRPERQADLSRMRRGRGLACAFY
jgi:hypothetical protein